MGNLKDKVVLVTGAGQGIGEGVALRLASDGGIIVVSDINIKNAKKVSEKIIENGGEIFTSTAISKIKIENECVKSVVLSNNKEEDIDYICKILPKMVKHLKANHWPIES